MIVKQVLSDDVLRRTGDGITFCVDHVIRRRDDGTFLCYHVVRNVGTAVCWGGGWPDG